MKIVFSLILVFFSAQSMACTTDADCAEPTPDCYQPPDVCSRFECVSRTHIATISLNPGNRIPTRVTVPPFSVSDASCSTNINIPRYDQNVTAFPHTVVYGPVQKRIENRPKASDTLPPIGYRIYQCMDYDTPAKYCR